MANGDQYSLNRPVPVISSEHARFWYTLLFLAPLVIVLSGLFVWPLWLLFRQSIELDGRYSFQKYADILLTAHYRNAFFSSIGLSCVVALAATLICSAPAWLLAHCEFRGKIILRSIIVLPMSFSGTIVGFLTILMLGRAGFVPALFGRIMGHPLFTGVAYDFSGLIIAYMYFEIPRATLTLESALRKFDLRLLAAAQSLGASRWQRLHRIILPIILPALISTFSITFCVSLGSFGVLLILATRNINVLPLEIFTAYVVNPADRALAAAMAFVLILIALTVNYTVRLLNNNIPTGTNARA